MKAKAQKLNKKGIARLLVIFFILALVVYSGFQLLGNAADITRLKALAADYETQYQQQINENEKVKAILDSENKDEYIEQKAREKGYVKDGEMVFYDISSSK